MSSSADADRVARAPAERPEPMAVARREPVAVEPPVYRRCSHCGHLPQREADDHLFHYSQIFPESGIRRVWVKCRVCRGGMFWDEEIPRGGGGNRDDEVQS